MQRPCVLLVEDEPDQREVYTVILQMRGFEVMPAVNGRDALEKIYERRPTIVVTDVSMPIMDGIELIRRIRGEEKFDDVPIIVMTSFQKAYLSWGWAQGANETLKKPFVPDELFELIYKLLPSLKPQPHNS